MSVPHHSVHSLSRRQFVAAASSALWMPSPEGSQTHGPAPKPIPRGTDLPWGAFIHHRPPKSGGKLAEMEDPSQITDFEGEVGICRVLGEGMEAVTKKGEARHLPFAADMGFMKGEFLGEDGRKHEGTFAFV